MPVIKVDLDSLNIEEQLAYVTSVIEREFPYSFENRGLDGWNYVPAMQTMSKTFGEKANTYLSSVTTEPTSITVDTDKLWARWNHHLRFKEEDDYALALMIVDH